MYETHGAAMESVLRYDRPPPVTELKVDNRQYALASLVFWAELRKGPKVQIGDAEVPTQPIPLGLAAGYLDLLH
jgi:hypothetical protein